MTEPVWVDERDALAIHEQAIGRNGGAAGLRDRTLLDSALARPKQLYAYSEAADIIEMATACTAWIVRNHPFLDGNKRTGFIAGILFLELNGYRFTASQALATQAVLHLAAGTLDETGHANFLRDHAEPR